MGSGGYTEEPYYCSVCMTRGRGVEGAASEFRHGLEEHIQG